MSFRGQPIVDVTKIFVAGHPSRSLLHVHIIPPGPWHAYLLDMDDETQAAGQTRGYVLSLRVFGFELPASQFNVNAVRAV